MIVVISTILSYMNYSYRCSYGTEAERKPID